MSTIVASGTHPNKAEISWDDFATAALPPHTLRVDLFRQAVSQAAATMDTPPYNDVKGKLTKAMDLVLTGKVQAHTDGLYTVQGSSRVYELDGECPCPQGQRAASKWCKHMVAVELWKRAQERLYGMNGNGNGHHSAPNGNGHPISHETQVGTLPTIPTDTCTHHWTDHEPPVVWHVEFVIDNVKHGVTVRCDDLTEAKAQVKEITALVKKAQADETHDVEDVPVCPEHGVAYRKHTKDGKSWMSHRQGDGWCRKK